MSYYMDLTVCVANVSTTKKCKLNDIEREDETKNLFESLSPKPDICLLQEAIVTEDSGINQVSDVIKALNFGTEGSVRTASEYEGEDVVKVTAIVCNDKLLWGKCFERTKFMYPNRFCAETFDTCGGEVLLASFHGLCVPQRKWHLQNFLTHICEEKRLSHLIIGGDFNLDLDEFGRENTQFLEQLNLKIITNQKQRDGEKIDGLICSGEIIDLGVNLFTDKDHQAKFSGNTLDHHPLMFHLRLPVDKPHEDFQKTFSLNCFDNHLICPYEPYVLKNCPLRRHTEINQLSTVSSERETRMPQTFTETEENIDEIYERYYSNARR